MNVTPFNSLIEPAVDVVSRADRRGPDFMQQFEQAQKRVAVEKDKADATAEADPAVRAAAEQLVASAFVLPLLQMFRDDPLRSDLMHGGTGEDLWGQQLDTHLSDALVKRSNFPLVDAVYDHIAGKPKQLRGPALWSRPTQGVDVHG